jgi:hypothetical protein
VYSRRPLVLLVGDDHGDAALEDAGRDQVSFSDLPTVSGSGELESLEDGSSSGAITILRLPVNGCITFCDGSHIRITSGDGGSWNVTRFFSVVVATGRCVVSGDGDRRHPIGVTVPLSKGTINDVSSQTRWNFRGNASFEANNCEANGSGQSAPSFSNIKPLRNRKSSQY